MIVGSLAPSNSSAPLAALGPTGAAAVPVATQRNGPQGGSAILNPSAQAFAPALSAATSGSTSLEQVRLSAMPTAITSSVGLAPVSTPGLSPAASQANVSVSGEATTKPLEVEKTYFQPIGITLPLQAVNLDRLGKEVGFQKELAQVRDDVMQIAAVDRNVVASSIGVSASFTIGYILWLVRGGVLISSLLASLPAWRLVDPLPVLGTLGGKRKDEDDKSLEELVQGQADRQELQRQEASLQESRMQEPRRSGAASQFANKAELDEASFSMP